MDLETTLGLLLIAAVAGWLLYWVFQAVVKHLIQPLAEFRRAPSTARDILETLMEEGIAAKAHFQTWWALRNLALPTYHPTMNDSVYVDFFHASNAGHYKLFFLALSKIFDRDSRVAGISNLRQALSDEGNAHLAHDLEQTLSPHKDLVVRVMNIRNKTIVHNEIEFPREKVYDINGVTPNEIRSLIDVTCEALNVTARALDFSNTIFESDRHETAVLAMLKILQRGKA